MPTYSITIDDEFANMITALAYDEGITKSRLISQVFGIYEFLKKEAVKNNGKIALVDKEGHIITEYQMPWEWEK